MEYKMKFISNACEYRDWVTYLITKESHSDYGCILSDAEIDESIKYFEWPKEFPCLVMSPCYDLLNTRRKLTFYYRKDVNLWHSLFE